MLSGIQDISTAEYEQMIELAIFGGKNLIVFGLGGTGKTFIAKATVLAAMKRPPIYLNLSTLEAPDLIGLPYRDAATDTARYSPPDFIPLSSRTPEPQVLLFDELDKAKPELQNPLLEIFYERTLNGKPLNVQAIIATANLPDEGAFSKPLSMPLCNRSMLFKTTAVFDEWQKWAASTGVNPLVVGFLSKFPIHFSVAPDKSDKTAYARPSPRSWTEAGDDLNKHEIFVKTRRVEDLVDAQTKVVASRVGTTAALQFRVWLEHYRHITGFVDALLATGAHPPTSLTMDRQLVLALAACGEVTKICQSKKASTADGRKTIERVFGWLTTIAQEVVIGSVKSTINIDMIIKNDLMKIPEVKDVFTKLAQILGMRAASKP